MRSSQRITKFFRIFGEIRHILYRLDLRHYCIPYFGTVTLTMAQAESRIDSGKQNDLPLHISYIVIPDIQQPANFPCLLLSKTRWCYNGTFFDFRKSRTAEKFIIISTYDKQSKAYSNGLLQYLMTRERGRVNSMYWAGNYSRDVCSDKEYAWTEWILNL